MEVVSCTCTFSCMLSKVLYAFKMFALRVTTYKYSNRLPSPGRINVVPGKRPSHVVTPRWYIVASSFSNRAVNPLSLLTSITNKLLNPIP